jgi:hypothetical protein
MHSTPILFEIQHAFAFARMVARFAKLCGQSRNKRHERYESSSAAQLRIMALGPREEQVQLVL